MLKRIAGIAAVIICAIGLAACGSGAQTMSQKVQGWNTSVGLIAIDQQINSDLQYLHPVKTFTAFQQLQTNCDGFPADTESLYETLPAPDTTLTNEFNNAVQSWETASRQCVNATGIKTVDYRNFVKDLAAGNRSYAAAVKLLATFGVG